MVKPRDLNDELREDGPEAVRESIDGAEKYESKSRANGGNEQATYDPRFKLIPFDQIRMSTAPNYLVKGILPRHGLVVFWGPPKCGKSFQVFDLMMHVALGWSYRGHKVRQGAVVYLALEGGTGFHARVAAWRQRHLQDHNGEVPFYLLTVPVDLIADHPKLITAINAQVASPAAVVIDTLNRSLNGDENKSSDMAAYIKAADAIRETFHCLVPVIHHCGIAGTRPRGHTSLTGADDAQIAVERNEHTGIITAVVEHVKDGLSGAVVQSRLESVVLGDDADGDPITSCVIVPVEGERVPRAEHKVHGAAKVALDALKEAVAEHGEKVTSSYIPPNVLVVPVDLWRHFCDARTITESDERDTKKRVFNRASKKLQELKIIGVWRDQVWLAGQVGQGGT